MWIIFVYISYNLNKNVEYSNNKILVFLNVYFCINCKYIKIYIYNISCWKNENIVINILFLVCYY